MTISPTGSLHARGVCAGYGRAPVLQGVDLVVPAGRVIGLSGPSGTGKSTLARVVTGLLAPIAGTVLVDGEPLRARRGRMTGRVGMLFQSPRRSCNPRMTLEQIIAEPLLLAGTSRRELPAAVRRLAADVGLTDDLLTRVPGQVSDGQLQRAALARALAHDPAYLVCDEATAMLDAVTTAVIARLVRDRAARGMGVLAISHDTQLLTAWADESFTLDALQDRDG